jgi:hypothetical protein
MSTDARRASKVYRIERAGFAFEFPPGQVTLLKTLPDFETKEEPAVADEFLRYRADGWAEKLADAGVRPGPVEVRIDTHQRRARLCRDEALLFAAEL